MQYDCVGKSLVGWTLGAVLVVGAALLARPAVADEGMGEKEKCEASMADTSTATTAEREAAVPSKYLAQVQGTLGGYMGGGFGGSYHYDGPAKDPFTFGARWNGSLRGDVDLLHPLWLGGTLTYFAGDNRSAVQLDAIAGLSWRTYGPRWVKAGTQVTSMGGGTYHVASWDSHCQLRREESTLFGGFKTQLAGGAAKGEPDPHNWFALQVGYLSTFRVNKLISWSVAGLFDPYHVA
ncbi:MAG: hypothetical protein HY902_13545, partial [Deltaproteobacteria bacterium]|nr:hypothetical protein [Deltaproteobacteria bacterium]